MRKLGKVLKHKNYTNYKFVFLADMGVPFLNKEFNDFNEAREYGNKIQRLKCFYGGYNLYKWCRDKWVRVLRWEEIS